MNRKGSHREDYQADPIAPPMDLAYQMHFVALAGVQPNLPQNVAESKKEAPKEQQITNIVHKAQEPIAEAAIT